MTQPDHHDGLPTRHVRIAAVAGGVVLIIGLAVAIGTASGSRPKPHHSAALAPSTGAPSIPPSAASGPPTTPTAAPSTAPAHPVVRWRGTLTLNGPDADRDLDSIPPRTSGQDPDVTGSTFETTIKADSDGVQLATVTGKSGFQQCRDAVAANGDDHTGSLHDGDVVCVLTSQGRVARLRVLHAALGFPAATVKADATVWDPPQPRG